jgi:hypothetical protein
MPITGSTKGKSYARLNLMRLGATRLDYYQPWFKVLINGVDQTSKIRIANASITQNLDGIPDTAAFRVSGLTPVKGQEIKVYMGDTDVTHCLFAGHILSVKTVYEDVATNIAYDLACIDYTWRLNDKKVLKPYTNQSATAIAIDLISTYASWCTTVHVATGLATVDEITFTNEDVTDALDRLAQRIGGYWYVDYAKDLHLFVTETAGTAQPVTDAADRTWDGISQDVDLSQVRTRAIVRGGGSNASCDLAAGVTSLPVTDGSWYSSGGGYVEVGAQRITYTSKSTLDGQGCVTAGNPGGAPTSLSAAQAAPYVTGNLAQTSSSDVYRYKVTFVSAAGESDASSPATGTIVKIANAGQPSGISGTTGGSLTLLGTYVYAVTFVTASGEVGYTTFFSSGFALTGSNNAFNLTGIPTSSDARVTSRKIYRTAASASTLKLALTIADNTTTTATDTTADASLGATMPTTDTGSTGKLTVTIPVGPVGTTSRKLYRTVKNGSDYKLQSTTADNTTTSVLDNTADGSLGASFGGSTTGASPGDTTLRVTDLSKFPDGGWIRVGSQLLLFTGRAATTGEGNLTGIPASGTGAITALIPASTTVTVEPHLTGIASAGAGSIQYAITSGTPANVRVERNDATAQTNLAGFLGTGDGVVEDFISDGRISITEANARGDAALSDHKDPLVTVSGVTRDQTVRPGRSVTFTVTNPPISGTFKIQRVTLTDLAIGGTQTYVFPKRQVDATSKRFSLEDLLRQMRQATAT